MAVWGTLLIAAAGLPVLRAWWSNRRTALLHAMTWGIAAWLTWLAAAAAGTVPARYLALAMTGCAGVAVLGARRPGVGAWNAVVAGLLAVLLLPLAQGLLAESDLPLDAIRAAFLGLALFIGIVNFVPTRLGLGAMTLLAASMLEVRRLDAAMPEGERVVALALAALAPWLAWLGLAVGPRTAQAGDGLWRDFRDRFGVVWAQRLREQFNRAAAHDKLPVELGWRGLRRRDAAAPTEAEQTASLTLLRALMTRFGLT